MIKLTLKQQAFCDYYIETANATEAAIKAGYSEKTARFVGCENLTKPNIRDYIDERMTEKESALIAKQDEVLKYLTKVMRREEKEYMVVTVRTKKSWVDDKGKRCTEETETPEIVEIPSRLSDSNKAAELLGKRYLLWTEKIDVDMKSQVVFTNEPPDDD